MSKIEARNQQLFNFVRARLDEDRTLAKDIKNVEVSITTKAELDQTNAAYRYRAANSPTNLMARVEAGNRLLTWALDASVEVSDGSGFEDWYLEPIKAFAMSWRTHPMYDSRWEGT